MRRLLAIFASIAVGTTAFAVATAGAEDTHTYRIELDNAFGLVSGSEVRVAGVLAGTVEDLDINSSKRAEVTIEVAGPLSSFRESATCTSQPQSLIAEYYLDCQPGNRGEELPDDGLVPVRSEEYGNQTFITVQNDLVFNTLREPFKQRLALIFNEFGTALSGNSENLNQAIRRGAPALTQLRRALAILARQNKVITQLNVDGDQIIGRLTDRREDVVSFIRNANRTAQASAARREDLAANFQRLPGFLTELRPTLAKLGTVADANTPLLADLQATAPQLTRLTRTLPTFNDAAEPAIRALGRASLVGRSALNEGTDEIDALRQATRKSFPAANQTANFLVDLDNPARRVETDDRAARDTGRPAPTGYTAMEGLLNYAYYQTTAINQYDQVGHLLHFTLTDLGESACGEYNAGPTVPKKGGGETTNAAETAGCVSWLGPNQPDINDPLNLPPYDPSVCPEGSADLSLCTPANPRKVASASGVDSSAGESGDLGDPGAGDEETAETPGAEDVVPEDPGTGEEAPLLPDLPSLPEGPAGPLDGILGNGPTGPTGATGITGPGGPLDGVLGTGSGAANQDLFNYLFGA